MQKDISSDTLETVKNGESSDVPPREQTQTLKYWEQLDAETSQRKLIRLQVLEWLRLEALSLARNLTDEERASHGEDLHRINSGGYDVLLRPEPVRWMFSGNVFGNRFKEGTGLPVRRLQPVARRLAKDVAGVSVSRTVVEFEPGDLEFVADAQKDDQRRLEASIKASLVPVLIDSRKGEEDVVAAIKLILKEAKAEQGRKRAIKKSDRPSVVHLWETLHWYRARQEKKITLEAIGRAVETFGAKDDYIHEPGRDLYTSRGNDVIELAEHMIALARSHPSVWWEAFPLS